MMDTNVMRKAQELITCSTGRVDFNRRVACRLQDRVPRSKTPEALLPKSPFNQHFLERAMAPATKRRKLAVAHEVVTKATSQQSQIHAFGRISKSTAAVACSTSKAGVDKLQEDALAPSSQDTPKKRRYDEISAVKSTIAGKETPSKGARAALDALSFQSTSSCSPGSRSPSHNNEDAEYDDATSCSSLPSTQGSKDARPLPFEVQDLINLHSSFLSALSLHFAHHSHQTPADLRSLNPTVTRLWRRRRVEIIDVRRILATAQSPLGEQANGRRQARLSLCDYGNGKICVELKSPASVQTSHRQPIEENTLNEIFEANLRTKWYQYVNNLDQSITTNPTHFIDELPLASIIVPRSVTSCDLILAKGQRRLEDLLQRTPRAEQASDEASSSTKSIRTGALLSSSSPSKPTISRQSSLLSRIKAKETLQASLPAPPSLEETQRRDALRRLEEIVPVFECLTSSHFQAEKEVGAGLSSKVAPQTVSFTKSTLITNLQQSMGNPISRDEASRSIDVLAEMAPAWATVRKIGKLDSVTFRAVQGVCRLAMMHRVRAALHK